MQRERGSVRRRGGGGFVGVGEAYIINLKVLNLEYTVTFFCLSSI